MSYFEHQDEMQGRVSASFNRAMNDWENRMPGEEEEGDPLKCPFCGSAEWEKMYETEDGMCLGCSDCISECADPYWNNDTQEHIDNYAIDNLFYHRLCEYIDKDTLAGFLEKQQVKDILSNFVYEYREQLFKRERWIKNDDNRRDKTESL